MKCAIIALIMLLAAPAQAADVILVNIICDCKIYKQYLVPGPVPESVERKTAIVRYFSYWKWQPTYAKPVEQTVYEMTSIGIDFRVEMILIDETECDEIIDEAWKSPVKREAA